MMLAFFSLCYFLEEEKPKGMQNALRVQPCVKWGFTAAIEHYDMLFSLKALKMPDMDSIFF